MADPDRIESVLKRSTRFRRLVHVAACASTQDLAAQPDANPATPDDAVFWADHQTEGRGRQQRTWSDEAGLDVAVTLRTTVALPEPTALPAALPVAVLQAAEPLAERRLRIKWPNDVYLGDQKLAGVLIDRDSRRPDTFRIGVGLNVNRTRFPSELQAIGTSLALATGRLHDRATVLLALATRIDAMLTALARGEGAELERLFRDRLGLLGERVEIDARERSSGVLRRIDFRELQVDDRPPVPLAIVRAMRRSAE